MYSEYQTYVTSGDVIFIPQTHFQHIGLLFGWQVQPRPKCVLWKPIISRITWVDIY